jgi:hypothetical protein
MLLGKWTLGRSRVRWANNIEIDYEKKKNQVQINVMCSGQRRGLMCRVMMVCVLYNMELS